MRGRGVSLAIVATAAASLSGPASAALLGTCTIVVTANGTLTPNAALNSLSSRNPGGTQAKATINASGGGGVLPSLLCSLDFLINCFKVSFIAPTSWTSAPAGEPLNPAFSATLDAVGSYALLSKIILNGDYAFAFDLTATKSSGVFRAGTYQARPTILCD